MLGELFAIYLLHKENEGGGRERKEATSNFISIFSFPCRMPHRILKTQNTDCTFLYLLEKGLKRDFFLAILGTMQKFTEENNY